MVEAHYELWEGGMSHCCSSSDMFLQHTSFMIKILRTYTKVFASLLDFSLKQ